MSETWQAAAWICGVGGGATLFMDGVALIRARLLQQRGLDWGLVGRWLRHVLRGQLVLPNPQTAPPVAMEHALGWGFHYGVGLALAALLWLLLPAETLQDPEVLTIVTFGLCTVVLPMLTLQPGLGMGLAARKMPQPWLARRRSLVTHVTFGLGLWLAAELMALALG